LSRSVSPRGQRADPPTDPTRRVAGSSGTHSGAWPLPGTSPWPPENTGSA
jgi:hypothetical protein